MSLGAPRVLALHGFLGTPHDFAPLRLESMYAPRIFNTPVTDLWSWANRFNRHAAPSVLLGYSMGGRLALHCVLSAPHQFKRLVILAAHPGLRTHEDRVARKVSDRSWAQQFLDDDWDRLITRWQSQPIFSGSQVISRHEGDFSRASLSSALRHFSLGEQEHLTPRINTLDMPILWLVPRAETGAIADLRLKNPKSSVVVVEGGHRFMFARNQSLFRVVREFVYSS